ncbi:MAG: hypothetical protein JWN46_3324 [Acidimicrobiales bacterium]|nr:hypothetical protein [Acidimicrobiales bacterium]
MRAPSELALDDLAGVMTAALGQPVTVDGLTRLKGGYSREMWTFDARTAAGDVLELVLCADGPAGVVERGAQSLDRVEEHALLQALHGHGLPVPAVFATGDGTHDLRRPFLVMERVSGTAAIGPLMREQHYVERRHAFATQKAEILAAIHAAPVLDTLPARLRPAPDALAADEVRRWAAAYDETPAAATPTVRSAIAWLEANIPAAPAELVLVHGDYRTGNLMYGPEGIRTVLDWEMAHLGDPVEDVAWAQLVSWRAGTGLVGVLVDQPTWVALYEKAAGRTVDPAVLRFWEVVAAVKMASLAWRAREMTEEPRERDLLGRIFDDLGRELGQVLRPD